MKRRFRTITFALVILSMLFSLAGCGKSKEDTLADYLAQDGMTQEELDQTIAASKTPSPDATAVPATGTTPAASSTPLPTIAPSGSQTVTPASTPLPTATPRPTAAPQVTPAPTPTPTPAPKYPTVTKSPTSETLTEGGNAVFVAYADNYQYITWRLVSSDGSRIIYMNEAPYNFSGLSVTGDGTSRLTLCNCPTSLSGWSVDAVFTGNGKQATTSRAYITVNAAPRVQLYASPSTGYFQYCDESIYVCGGARDQYYYELYRDGGYGSSLYTSGTKSCGEPVYLACENGVCYSYYLYAYVLGDSSNAISCSYTVDGTTSVCETVYATEGYDNAGFASRYVTQSGWYNFSVQTYNMETFDIYILDSYFTDADRYIPQAYGCSMSLYASSSGGLYLNAGQYVYVQCNQNSLTGEMPSSQSYVQWTME